MPMARSRYILIEATPYYPWIGRCVRRAFLWGKDHLSDRDFSHRKAWVLEHLAELSEVFSMTVCAYAVIPNHYYVVVHIDRQRAEQMSQTEVLTRWARMCSFPTLSISSCKAKIKMQQRDALRMVWSSNFTLGFTKYLSSCAVWKNW